MEAVAALFMILFGLAVFAGMIFLFWVWLARRRT